MPAPELVYSRSKSRAAWTEASDADLLHGLARGDELALDELIGRKTRPLLVLAARIVGDEDDARDVVQLTFLRLWDHRERYDSRFSPNTWIYRIATNLAIDHLRSRRSRQRATEPVRAHLRRVGDDRFQSETSELQQREVQAIFHELSGELSEKQRAVFLLREVEGLSSEEVAAIVGCQESTVRNHLFNARKLLRRALLERYPEYAPAAARGLAGES
ncbi:MAG: RNA polymerase sigma factor [Acidobacteriota bacterium]